MTNLIIQQGNTPENISSTVIDKLYRLALQNTEAGIPVMELSGSITPNAAYEDAVAYLRAKFPNLTININIDDCYIRFADNAVKNKLLNSGIGDTIGVTFAQAAIADLTSNNVSIFKGNTDITSFNEFKRFTKANGLTQQKEMFQGCTNLEEIDLTELTYANASFLRSTKISVVNAPNLVQVGSGYQFQDCTNLKTILSLGSITSIPANMCYQCTNLETVNLPPECTFIGNQGFARCTNLTTLNGLNNITMFGNSALQSCSSLIINASSDLSPDITYIGGQAFGGIQGLTGVLNLPKLTTLQNSAFDFTKLDGIKCLGTVSEISDYNMFRNRFNTGSIQYAYLPYETTKIGGTSFQNQTLLTTVKQYDKSVNDWQEEETPTYGPLSKITTFGNECFSGCTQLTLTEDDLAGAINIGNSAFAKTALNANYLDLHNVSSIGTAAFVDTTIKSVNWSDNINYIPHQTFNNCKLEHITNIDRVTRLNGYTFVGCNLDHVLYLKNVDGYTQSKNTGRTDYYNNFAANWHSSYLPALYMPKLPYVSGEYYSDNQYCIGFFGSKGSVNIPVVYFRDITDIYPSSFEALNCTSLIINNTTPPTWRNYNDLSDSETTDASRKKDRAFPADGSTQISNIYVPDSALQDYLNDADWGSLPTRANNPINILSMNLLTHYSTEEDWVNAGKPVTGIIDAYM